MIVYENFIAYRRSESSREAKLLYENLKSRGFDTLLDTEELTSGDYKNHLYEIASTCTNYIVILTNTSFDRSNKEKEDLFVRGIEYAMYNKKNVIPVFLSDEIIFPGNIPEAIDKIKDLNGCTFVPERKEQCIDDIVKKFLVNRRNLSLSDPNRDFLIENEVLVEYVGNAAVIEIPEKIKIIASNAFKDKTKITKIVFPDGLEEIEESAFERCINITSFNLPTSIKKIGKKAFSRCYNLAYINLGERLSLIDEEAFSSCSKLKWIDIPINVEHIAGSSFNGCSNLEKIRVDNSNTWYSEEDGILYDKLKTLVVRCPENCDLDYVDIPSTVKTIGEYSFFRCFNISQITLPRTVEEVCEHAFEECGNMSSMVLSGSIKKFALKSIDGWEKDKIHFSRDFSPVERRKIEKALESMGEEETEKYDCEFVMIKTTFESIEEAKNMAQMLVKSKRIVSGQIHQIESIYLWEKEMNDEFEYELSCITTSNHVGKTKKFICKNHSYENCQILICPIIDTSKEIANWIYESLEVKI